MTKYRHSLNPKHRLEGVPLQERITTGQLRRTGSTIGLRLMALIISQQRYADCEKLVYGLIVHYGDPQVRRDAWLHYRGKKNPLL